MPTYELQCNLCGKSEAKIYILVVPNAGNPASICIKCLSRENQGKILGIMEQVHNWIQQHKMKDSSIQ